VRIVSYNILNGGEGRADPLAEVILARAPDVVCVVEADDPAVLERIAKRLKMEYVLAPAGRHGAALMSRWPIVQSVDHAALREEFTGTLLEAVVAEPRSQLFSMLLPPIAPRAGRIFSQAISTRTRRRS
jgi:endonuclease/exonuclease/phosphatase family metal-dependent hydrolase